LVRNAVGSSNIFKEYGVSCPLAPLNGFPRLWLGLEILLIVFHA